MAQSRSIVRPYGDPLIGQSPTDLRLAHAVSFAHASLSAWGARPGVLWGGTVRGTAGWAYEVDPAALAMTRGALEGVYPAAITGVQSVPTDPAPGSGSRIDIVYALQQDPDLLDLGNDPILDVAIGTASGSPQAPALPAGAMELGRATITSVMTQTLDASVATTSPITALLGGRYKVPAIQQASRITAPLPGDMLVTNGGAEYEWSGSSWDRVWRAPNAANPDATTYDTGWINLGLTNGWSAEASFPPQFRRVGVDVQLRGRVRTTSGNPTSGDIIPCFIPDTTAGRSAKPTTLMDFVGFIGARPTTGNFYRQFVDQNGSVNLYGAPSASLFYLTTIQYMVD